MISQKNILYKCNRCNIYDTNKFSNIKKHFFRKKYCHISKESLHLSDDQLFIMSIMPYNNNIHSVSLSDLEYLSESKFISENKNKLFDELLYIDKNNIRKCKYCNEEFSLISNLKKHLICTCFYKHNINNTLTNNANDANDANDENDENDENDANIVNNNSNNISNNNSNNTTVNSNNTYNNCDINNINLYVDLKIPIPFEEDWEILID